MTGDEVLKAFKFVSWDQIYEAKDGEEFGLLIGGEPVKVVKVHSDHKEDYDYDRHVTVVIEVNGEYFQRDGYMNVGSHCYGDYEDISWNALRKVTPRTKTVTVWE